MMDQSFFIVMEEIGFHHDKSPHFVHGSSVMTVSFGCERVFKLRNLKTKKILSFDTKNGSLSILDWQTNIVLEKQVEM